MNIVKKTMMSVLFGLSVLGLTTSMSANALNANAEATCPGCHGVIIGTTQAVGSGGRKCLQRSVSEWLSAISKMKNKSCNVVAGTEQGMAEYLACVENPACSTSTTTTTTSSTTSTTSTTTLPPTTGDYDMGITLTGSTSYPIFDHPNSYGVSYNATITNHGPGIGVADIYFKDPVSIGYSSIYISNCVATGRYGCRATLASGAQATVTASTANVGLGTNTLFNIFLTDVLGDTLIETNSANNSASLSLASPPTSTSSSTTSSTTSTTLCNTYVNGTTQYPYSGSGSCHSFANDDVTGLHIVRDQSYCKKHMSHLNSRGNHVHAYPHPMCM